MKTYWLSWNDLDPEITVSAVNFLVWCTGHGGSDEEILCACVDAETEDQAWEQVEAVYTNARRHSRFTVEHVFGWRPPTDRFPMENKS